MKHLGENYETLAKLMNLLAVVLTVISCALIIIGACSEVFYTSEFNSGETYAEEGFYDYLDIVKSTDFTSLSSVNLFSYIMLVSAVVFPGAYPLCYRAVIQNSGWTATPYNSYSSLDLP